MSRIGFDKEKHPYQLQLRIASGFDIHGLQNSSSVNINFLKGIITDYHTDDDQIKTNIQEYIASDDEMKDLYSFFTFDALEKFDAMPESEKSQYDIGYYDNANLLFLMICGDGRVTDGHRHGVYSNDPIHMALEWMDKILPFDAHVIWDFVLLN